MLLLLAQLIAYYLTATIASQISQPNKQSQEFRLYLVMKLLLRRDENNKTYKTVWQPKSSL